MISIHDYSIIFFERQLLREGYRWRKWLKLCKVFVEKNGIVDIFPDFDIPLKFKA